MGGIETGATADQTAAEIRALVEAASDSNVFTDDDHTKLGGIAAGADVTPSWVPDSDPNYLTDIPADVLRDEDFIVVNSRVATINHEGVVRGFSGSVNVQNDGTAVGAPATTLNFTGDGVTASGANGTKTITINTGSWWRWWSDCSR